MQFSRYLDFFVPSDSRFSNSCIENIVLSNKHTPMESLFSFQMLHKSQLQKMTIVTGFVVQGHIWEWFLKGHVRLE